MKKSNNSQGSYSDNVSLGEPIAILEYKQALRLVTGKSSNSFDNTGFHPSMWQHVSVVASACLLNLFNLCMTYLVWPWQDSNIVFLKKGGKPSYAKAVAYRPICIFSCVGKLLEKILYLHLDKYFASSGMVDMYQEGFTKNRNSIRYLNRLNLHIKSGKENGNTVIGLFLDFEKGFDSVWKKALSLKLFDHGVNGVFLCLVNTYLFSRKVALKVNSFLGPSRKTGEYGLPQGSVLSPLFLNFM